MGIVTGLWLKEGQAVNKVTNKIFGKPLFKDALIDKAQQFDAKYGKAVDVVAAAGLAAFGGPAAIKGIKAGVGKITAVARAKQNNSAQEMQQQALDNLKSKGLSTTYEGLGGITKFPTPKLEVPPTIKVPESIIKKSEDLLTTKAEEQDAKKGNNTNLIAILAAAMFLL